MSRQHCLKHCGLIGFSRILDISFSFFTATVLGVGTVIFDRRVAIVSQELLGI